MKIKQKRVSSFLKKRREERMNMSQTSMDLDVSPNSSLLNMTDMGESYEDRKLKFELDLDGAKTQRISILDGFEEFSNRKEGQKSLTDRPREEFRSVSVMDEMDELNEIKECERKEKRRKNSRTIGLLAVSAGIIAGGILFLMKRKRFF